MRIAAIATLPSFVATGSAATPDRITLSDDVREKCLSVLREGLKSDEFWPSIHAAEGLTLAGRGEEVIDWPKPNPQCPIQGHPVPATPFGGRFRIELGIM